MWRVHKCPQKKVYWVVLNCFFGDCIAYSHQMDPGRRWGYCWDKLADWSPIMEGHPSWMDWWIGWSSPLVLPSAMDVSRGGGGRLRPPDWTDQTIRCNWRKEGAAIWRALKICWALIQRGTSSHLKPPAQIWTQFCTSRWIGTYDTEMSLFSWQWRKLTTSTQCWLRFNPQKNNVASKR